MGKWFFFRFQILLSHNNNHLTAPCGLAAASDVEGEAHAAEQWPIPYITTQHVEWISHHSSPLCLIGASQSARTKCRRAHTYAFHLFIPGPNLGQVLLNISGNILTEKAKHRLERRIKNNAGVQGHSLKA